MKLFFFLEGKVTTKMKRDRIDILPDGLDIKIVQIDATAPDLDNSICIARDRLIAFIYDNTFDIAMLNVGIRPPFFIIIKALKVKGIPYGIIHNKYNATLLDVLKNNQGGWIKIKRLFSRARKVFYSTYYAPKWQFVCSISSWLYDSNQLPPRDNIILIHHQDADLFIREKTIYTDEILFLDSYLFGHPDFKVKLANREEYLSQLRVDLKSYSVKLGLPYRIALHPSAPMDEYLPYFAQDLLFLYKDNPVIPTVTLSEGSTLQESLLPFCQNAFLYRSITLRVSTQKHRSFLSYGDSLLKNNGLKLINELDDLSVQTTTKRKSSEKIYTNKELITRTFLHN